MMFKDFEDFKSRAEHFPRGRIVPRRVMRLTHSKTGRRFKYPHIMKFGGDVYIATVMGHKIAIPDPDAKYFIEFCPKKAVRDITFQSAPYVNTLTFFGWCDSDPVRGANEFIAKLFSKSTQPEGA